MAGTQKTRICLPGEKPRDVFLKDLGPIISKIACCQCASNEKPLSEKSQAEKADTTNPVNLKD